MLKLTTDTYDALDADQRGAIARYVHDQLGPGALDNAVELRWYHGAGDDPSCLEVDVWTGERDDDGALLTRCHMVTAAPEPPALHRWTADELVAADVETAPKRTRRRRQ